MKRRVKVKALRSEVFRGRRDLKNRIEFVLLYQDLDDVLMY